MNYQQALSQVIDLNDSLQQTEQEDSQIYLASLAAVDSIRKTVDLGSIESLSVGGYLIPNHPKALQVFLESAGIDPQVPSREALQL